MPNVAFTPKIFENDLACQRFFDTSDEVAEILKEADSPPPSQWQPRVCCPSLATRVWRVVSDIFGCLASFFKGLRCASLSRRCSLLETYYYSLALQLMTRERLLAPTINSHRWDTSDLYLLPELEFQTQNGPVKLRFFHEGVCAGMSIWYMTLYLKTLDRFQNEEAHYAAVGKRFALGANHQAGILQVFCGRQIDGKQPARQALEKDVLALKIQHDFSVLSGSQMSRDAVAKKIRKLPLGAYTVRVGAHQVNYFKLDADKAIIFDPNLGTFSKQGIDAAEKTAAYLCKYFRKADHGETQGIHFDQVLRPDGTAAISNRNPGVLQKTA